jgi:hypothetical protein
MNYDQNDKAEKLAYEQKIKQAEQGVQRNKRNREAALARCLVSPDNVPTPEDVDCIRHLFIRLDQRVDGQRLLTGGRQETWDDIRGLLVRWEELGAGCVDSILNSRGGGERDTWKAIQQWADKEHLRSVKGKGTGTPAKSFKRATVNQRMSAMILQDCGMVAAWNSSQWAKHLKCAKSTVVATQAWKHLEMTRLKAKAERRNDRRRKPKGSDLRKD